VARTYRYISGDSHLEIDSRYWIDRIPAKYRDQAPRLVRQADGSDAWTIGEKIVRPAAAADLYGGKGRDEYVPFGGRYEGTPGTGTPEQRLQEQDQDGIDAEVLFPSQQGGPKFWRRIEDDIAYKAVVRAYNGWLAEEYCAVAAERLIGVGILPLTHDVADSIEEMEQCATAGLKTVLLQGFPSGKAYPSKEDDPFWAAALALKMPVSVHVDLDRSGERAGPLFKYPQESDELMKKLSHDLVDQVGRFGPVRGNGSVAAVQWVLSGLFDRFPNLRIFFAENQIGWIPFFFCRQRTCAMTATSDGRSACSVSNLCAGCRASTSASIACGDFNSIESALSCATRSMSMVSSGARIFRIRNPTGPNP
jgi:predicted TIM-barrel fold metal-dependent hydrolase